MADVINYPQRWLGEHKALKSSVGWYRHKTYEVLKCQKFLNDVLVEVADVYLTIPDIVECVDTIPLTLKFYPRIANQLDYHLIISDLTICRYDEDANELVFLDKPGVVDITVTMINGGATATKRVISKRDALSVKIKEGNTFKQNQAKLSTFEFIPNDASEEVKNVSIWNNRQVEITETDVKNKYLIKCNTVGDFTLNVESNRKTYKLPISSFSGDEILVENILFDVKDYYNIGEIIHINPILLPTNATLKDYKIFIDDPEIAYYNVSKNTIIVKEKLGNTKVTIKMNHGNAFFEFNLQVGEIKYDLIERFETDFFDKIDYRAKIDVDARVFPETANKEKYIITTEGDLKVENNILTATKNVGEGVLIITATDGSGVVYRHPLKIETMENVLTGMTIGYLNLPITSDDINAPVNYLYPNFKTTTGFTNNLSKKFIVRHTGPIANFHITDELSSGLIFSVIEHGYGSFYIKDMYTGIDLFYEFKIYDHKQKLTSMSISKLPEKVNVGDEFSYSLNVVPEFAAPASFSINTRDENIHMYKSSNNFKATNITFPENSWEYIYIDINYYIEIDGKEEKVEKHIVYRFKVVDYEIETPHSMEVKGLTHIYDRGNLEVVKVKFRDKDGNSISGSSLIDNNIMIYGESTDEPKNEMYTWFISDTKRDDSGQVYLDEDGYQHFETSYITDNDGYLGRRYDLTISHISSGLSRKTNHIIEDSKNTAEHIKLVLSNKYNARYSDNIIAVGTSYVLNVETKPAYFEYLFDNDLIEVITSSNLKSTKSKDEYGFSYYAIDVISEGTSFIEVRMVDNSNSIREIYQANNIIEITSITHPYKPESIIFVGETINITPLVEPVNATYKDEYEIIYATDNIEVIDRNTVKVLYSNNKYNSLRVEQKFKRETSYINAAVFDNVKDVTISNLEFGVITTDNDFSFSNFTAASDDGILIPNDSISGDNISIAVYNNGTYSYVRGVNLGSYRIDIKENYKSDKIIKTYTGEVIEIGDIRGIRVNNFKNSLYYHNNTLRVGDKIEFATYPYYKLATYDISTSNNHSTSGNSIVFETVGEDVINVNASNTYNNLTVSESYNVTIYPKISPVDVSKIDYTTIPEVIMRNKMYKFKINSTDENFRSHQDLKLEIIPNTMFIRYSEIDREYEISSDIVTDYKVNVIEAESNNILTTIEGKVLSEVAIIDFDSHYIETGLRKELKFIDSKIPGFKILDAYEESNKFSFDSSYFSSNRLVYDLSKNYINKGLVVYVLAWDDIDQRSIKTKYIFKGI